MRRFTLQLKFKGDVKRETFFLQQWGQSMATPSCAIAICLLDPPRHMAAIALIVSVAIAATICFVLKRMLGRVRPNRPGAGRFLGPSLRHDSPSPELSVESQCLRVRALDIARAALPGGRAVVLGTGDRNRAAAICARCALAQRCAGGDRDRILQRIWNDVFVSR